MKKILILYGEGNWKSKKLFEKIIYKNSYEYFYDLARKNGLEMFRASYKWYDHNKKIFKHAWTFNDNQWKRVNNLKPDLIHDKTKSRLEIHYFKEQLKNEYKIINDPEFTLLADNKFYTSLIFPKYFKRYYKVKNKKDIQDLFGILKSKKIVLKPALGSGGHGVLIIEKKEIDKLKISNELIAQEFVESSNGISGIVKGVHDLRLVFINDELIYSYIRQPKEGSLLANLAQGGSMFIVEPSKLPKSLKPIIENIQDVFRFYNPKIYTIDLIFDKNQKPWIVELNTMPGMYFYPDQKKWMDKMYLGMIKIFKNF